MNQIISIIDVSRIRLEAVINAGIPRAQLCLKEIERIKGGNAFLAGGSVSLADLYLVPIVFYLKLTPAGELIASHKVTAPNLG